MVSRFSRHRLKRANNSVGCRLQEYDSPARSFIAKANSDNAGTLIIAGLENIANQTGCSKKTLYKWIRHRQFPAFKMDGVWRAMPKDIEAWFDGIRHYGAE